VDPFFLPLPIPSPVTTEPGRETFQKLEQCLDVALCLLRKTAERLRTAVGPDALEPELNRFLLEIDPVALSELVFRFDSHIKARQETEAVRLFRELLLVTWDQAHDLYACWSSWSHAEKLRCLQAAELRKLFAALPESSRVID
jgi:hypothetical protein